MVLGTAIIRYYTAIICYYVTLVLRYYDMVLCCCGTVILRYYVAVVVLMSDARLEACFSESVASSSFDDEEEKKGCTLLPFSQSCRRAQRKGVHLRVTMLWPQGNDY